MKVTIEDNVKRDETLEKMTQGLLNGIYLATNLVHKDAIKNAPVKTGALRNSLSMQVDEEKYMGEVYVPENSPAAKYAPRLELTEPPMNPQNVGKIPYLRPALYDNADKIIDIINKEIEKKIR